jgi:uncharacterized membrane protein YozB (DUF420 family)
VWVSCSWDGRESQRAYDLSALPTLKRLPQQNKCSPAHRRICFIGLKKVTAHKTCVVTAFGVSSLFLISYLFYYYRVGSAPFGGTGWIRPVYFTLIVLAACIVPLALMTIYRAWTETLRST